MAGRTPDGMVKKTHPTCSAVTQSVTIEGILINEIIPLDCADADPSSVVLDGSGKGSGIVLCKGKMPLPYGGNDLFQLNVSYR